jgi:hypothetical protein
VISGPSIGETMGRHGVIFRRADNTRLSRDKRMGGFDQIRARLNGDPDGRPMFYAQASSMHLRRTMPIMQHDFERRGHGLRPRGSRRRRAPLRADVAVHILRVTSEWRTRTHY